MGINLDRPKGVILFPPIFAIMNFLDFEGSQKTPTQNEDVDKKMKEKMIESVSNDDLVKTKSKNSLKEPPSKIFNISIANPEFILVENATDRHSLAIVLSFGFVGNYSFRDEVKHSSFSFNQLQVLF